jgi:hypothetical protein
MSVRPLVTPELRITMPRKLVEAYAEAVRLRQTGNFVIHVRHGRVMGLSFEQKESYDDLDRLDEIALG